MRNLYYLTFFFAYLKYGFTAYDSYNGLLSFHLDCDKGISDKSPFNRFITSYGVTLGKNRNNNTDMSCYFKNGKYLETNVSNFPFYDMAISFWIKNSTTFTGSLFTISNATNGFKLYFNDSTKNAQLIEWNNEKVLFKEYLTQNYSYWNQITLTFNQSNSSFSVNDTLEIQRSFELFELSTASKHSLVIGQMNKTPNDTDCYIDNFKIYNQFYSYQDPNITQLIKNNFCESNEIQYTLNKVCEKCSISNCESCYNSTDCAVCNRGFTKTTFNNCTCQKESCSECNYDGSCYRCDPGYILNENGNCILISCTHLDYCTKCVGNICLECVGEYGVKSDKCELPSSGIIGVVVSFLIIVIIIWILIIVLVRPKLIPDNPL